jgi:hypothetical protein
MPSVRANLPCPPVGLDCRPAIERSDNRTPLVLQYTGTPALCIATLSQPTPGGQTVATGVAGEPTAPGSLSGGPVNRKRLRSFARSQSANGVR